MSEKNATISNQEVLHIAKLAALAIDDKTCHESAEALTKILSLMQSLSNIPTDGVEAMHSPFARVQILRDDEANEDIDRDALQSIAPASADGCYLVPKVID